MEAVRSGCTAVVDHHASPHYIAGSLSQLRNAFLKIGLRGMTCFETTDRNFGSRELRDSVEENIRFAREIDAAREKGDQPYLVEAHIGAHAPFTVPDEGLAMLREALKPPAAACISTRRKTATMSLTAITFTARTCWCGWRSSTLSTVRR
jgi:cytosine/adenosine deaminase-related metal-dependent hydrolase